MSRILLLEDDGGATLIASNLMNLYHHEVHIANDLRELICFLEVNPFNEKYDTVILDLTVPGAVNYEIPGTEWIVTYSDSEGMHGYEYFRQEFKPTPKEESERKIQERPYVLRSYKGRIGFYTAYQERVKDRARQDGLDISDCAIFDKSFSTVQDVEQWLMKLGRVRK